FLLVSIQEDRQQRREEVQQRAEQDRQDDRGRADEVDEVAPRIPERAYLVGRIVDLRPDRVLVEELRRPERDRAQIPSHQVGRVSIVVLRDHLALVERPQLVRPVAELEYRPSRMVPEPYA